MSTTAVMTRRVGDRTMSFQQPVQIEAASSVVGPLEGQGPLAAFFDKRFTDRLLGQKHWEEAERTLMREALHAALAKAKLTEDEVDYLIAGDLLDQLGSASFAARQIDIPLFGIFAACATWAEGLTLAAVLVGSGAAERVAVAVSSHHEAAERQFRYPVEFGYQRPQTATWTTTGGAAAIIGVGSGQGRAAPAITHATPGRVVDMGARSPFHLGAAEAGAAAETIVAHFRDTRRGPEDYDLVVTGDLGRYGLPIAEQLVSRAGYPGIRGVLADCGIMLYDEKQGVGGGGSGAACTAVTFNGYLLRQMAERKLQRVLLVSTGALFSPTTYHQGESIPAIAHAVAVEWRAQG